MTVHTDCLSRSKRVMFSWVGITVYLLTKEERWGNYLPRRTAFVHLLNWNINSYSNSTILRAFSWDRPTNLWVMLGYSKIENVKLRKGICFKNSLSKMIMLFAVDNHNYGKKIIDLSFKVVTGKIYIFHKIS